MQQRTVYNDENNKYLSVKSSHCIRRIGNMRRLVAALQSKLTQNDE